MNKPAQPTLKQVAKTYLNAWAAQSDSHLRATILLQSLATAAWIMIAWGVGHAVAAVSQAEPAFLPIFVAALGAAVRTLLVWQADTSAANAGMRMTAAARETIFNQISDVGAGLLSGVGAGERTSQIIDRTAKLYGYGARWLPGMRLAIIGPVIILIAVATQSWLAAALLLVSVLVLPVFIWLTASETAAIARAQQSSLDALSGAFQSRTAKAGLIRAFRGVARQTRVLEDASDTLRQKTMAVLKTAFLSTAVMEFFASISIALVAVYIGFKLLGIFPFGTGETITLAEGLTVLVMVPEFFAPIRRLSSLHHDRADGVAAAEMIGPWLETGFEKKVHRLKRLLCAPEIEFRGVALSFGGAAPFLAPTSFTARPSYMTALSGPSGSGKTSCLLALLGNNTLASGEILINGVPLEHGASLADSVAYLRQTPWVTEGSLADNIALARPEASKAEIESAAMQAGVMTFATVERGGLDQPLARFGAGLSGGERQRLALARAVLRDAPIWLLDEPTAHLDEQTEKDFLQRLRSISQGRTVLITSHSESVLSVCDEVINLTPAAAAETRAP